MRRVTANPPIAVTLLRFPHLLAFLPLGNNGMNLFATVWGFAETAKKPVENLEKLEKLFWNAPNRPLGRKHRSHGFLERVK